MDGVCLPGDAAHPQAAVQARAYGQKSRAEPVMSPRRWHHSGHSGSTPKRRRSLGPFMEFGTPVKVKEEEEEEEKKTPEKDKAGEKEEAKQTPEATIAAEPTTAPISSSGANSASSGTDLLPVQKKLFDDVPSLFDEEEE